jgi:hypothetical protein
MDSQEKVKQLIELREKARLGGGLQTLTFKIGTRNAASFSPGHQQIGGFLLNKFDFGF